MFLTAEKSWSRGHIANLLQKAVFIRNYSVSRKNWRASGICRRRERGKYEEK